MDKVTQDQTFKVDNKNPLASAEKSMKPLAKNYCFEGMKALTLKSNMLV